MAKRVLPAIQSRRKVIAYVLAAFGEFPGERPVATTSAAAAAFEAFDVELRLPVARVETVELSELGHLVGSSHSVGLMCDYRSDQALLVAEVVAEFEALTCAADRTSRTLTAAMPRSRIRSAAAWTIAT